MIKMGKICHNNDNSASKVHIIIWKRDSFQSISNWSISNPLKTVALMTDDDAGKDDFIFSRSLGDMLPVWSDRDFGERWHFSVPLLDWNSSSDCLLGI